MRDPRIDPAPGDWLSTGIVDARVDVVGDGHVRFVRFPVDHDIGEVLRIPLRMWRAETVKADVLAMSVEGDR